MFKTFSSALVIVAMLGCHIALAQDCGCGGGAVSGAAWGDAYAAPVAAGSFGNYGSYGGVGFSNCGRRVNTQQAASLWSGYCSEDCGYYGPSGSCKLFGRLKGHSGGGLLSGGGCGGCGGGGGWGIGSGPFGYPGGGCGGGCGTRAGGGLFAGGFLSKIFGGCQLRGGGSAFGGSSYGGGSGCGGGSGFGGGSGCALFSKFKTKSGGWGTGCGLFSKICRKKQQASFVYVDSFDGCGCGDNGGYFDYAVGAEYGTAGFQSVTAGTATSACGGCGGGEMFMSNSMGQPAMQDSFQMSQPAYQNVNGGVPYQTGSPVQGLPSQGMPVQSLPAQGSSSR